MDQFATAREAKEYLIDRILRQAGQDGVSLTDVERKMLYFSESGWTLPDMMAINTQFDQRYTQDEYEDKIAAIVRHLQEGDGDQRRWNDAVGQLRTEDHYLLVLIDGASRPPTSARPPGDILRLILTGCVVAVLSIALMFVLDSHVSNRELSKVLFFVTFIILLAGAMYLNRRTTRR
jgi:hypothetical protein